MGYTEQREIAAWQLGDGPAVPACAIRLRLRIDRSSLPSEFFDFQTAFGSDPDSPYASDP